MRRRSNLWFVLTLALAITAGCSDAGSGPAESTLPATNVNASLNKEDYPVFPNPDAGADPSVPAEQGGAGFTGEGWETNVDFDLVGDPRAVKGGTLRGDIPSFPGTLRLFGPESNTQLNYSIMGLMYESLLGMDFKTMQYVPSLATHWQISEDRSTYRFRIDPNARWSDGQPVTAEDVVATYDFLTDPGLQDLTYRAVLGRFERPVAESKYIVRTRSKEPYWRAFLSFSGLPIFPAHVLKDVDGETYLRDYNFKYLPGTGPYIVRDEDIRKGQSLAITRRDDYWAEDSRGNVGAYNFDRIEYVVVRDDNLAFEMFKKGELDYYYVGSARRWVNELNFDEIQRGLIQKVKVFNNEPQGFSGLAMNTRRPPFNDIRVRKALALLLNRDQLIEKIMFNEYLPLTSYWPGTAYENKNNPKNEHNPEEALRLLAEAGWDSRDAQGRLVKNGQPLQIELLYDTPTFEPHLTVYQEDLRRVGITLNLRLVNPETRWAQVMDRRFDMALQAWGALLFPNPESSWHSTFADQPGNNNITGFKNARADEIIAEYNREFDPERRVALIQELDGIIANDYPYILFWYGPYQRLLFWNKFGTPEGYIGRTADYLGAGSGPGIPQLWWVDGAMVTALNEARANPSMKLDIRPAEDRYWLEWSAGQSPTAAGAPGNQ